MANASNCIGCDFSDELECPVCLDSWKSPVELSPCGHIYCAACLRSLGEAAGREVRCAVCRELVQQTRTPNRTLVNLSLSVKVECQNCGWSGKREESLRHTCRAEDVERWKREKEGGVAVSHVSSGRRSRTRISSSHTAVVVAVAGGADGGGGGASYPPPPPPYPIVRGGGPANSAAAAGATVGNGNGYSAGTGWSSGAPSSSALPAPSSGATTANTTSAASPSGYNTESVMAYLFSPPPPGYVSPGSPTNGVTPTGSADSGSSPSGNVTTTTNNNAGTMGTFVSSSVSGTLPQQSFPPPPPQGAAAAAAAATVGGGGRAEVYPTLHQQHHQQHHHHYQQHHHHYQQHHHHYQQQQQHPGTTTSTTTTTNNTNNNNNAGTMMAMSSAPAGSYSGSFAYNRTGPPPPPAHPPTLNAVAGGAVPAPHQPHLPAPAPAQGSYPASYATVPPPNRNGSSSSSRNSSHNNSFGLTAEELQQQAYYLDYYKQQQQQRQQQHHHQQQQNGVNNRYYDPYQGNNNHNTDNTRYNSNGGVPALGSLSSSSYAYASGPYHPLSSHPSGGGFVPGTPRIGTGNDGGGGGGGTPRYTHEVIQPPPGHPRPWSFYGISQEEYDQIISLFVFFDQDESGDLSRAELTRLATWLNFARTPQEIDQIFYSMDVSGDGSLTKEEFLTWLAYNKPDPEKLYGLSQSQYNTIMMQFQLYDGNQDGRLNEEEFIRLLLHLRDVPGRREGSQLFRQIDAAGKGSLNLHEFLRFRAGYR